MDQIFTFCLNDELLHAITAYEGKNHCITIMVSSPNAPGGLLETIEKDWNSKDKKLLLDYTYGLDKLYNRQEMKVKTLEPEFRRECMGYNLSNSGNLFSAFQPHKLTIVSKLGEQLKNIQFQIITIIL